MDEVEGRLWAESNSFHYFETSAFTGQEIGHVFKVFILTHAHAHIYIYVVHVDFICCFVSVIVRFSLQFRHYYTGCMLVNARTEVEKPIVFLPLGWLIYTLRCQLYQ